MLHVFVISSSKRQTTHEQFYALVSAMEDHPDLATNAPSFGSNKADLDKRWDDISKSLNALGPPERTVNEWKKVWADLKSRTKKKIAENNKNMKGTGGGPGKRLMLTELEKSIDRIVHLSVAAAPEGEDFGIVSEDSDDNKFSPHLTKKLKVDLSTPDFLLPKKKFTKTSSAKKMRQDEQIRMLKEQVQASKEQVQAGKDVVEAINLQTSVLRDICDALKSISEKLDRK